MIEYFTVIGRAWLLALILFLPGWVWSRHSLRQANGGVVLTTALVWTGSLVILISWSLLLAELGWFNLAALLGGLLLWVVCGLWFGRDTSPTVSGGEWSGFLLSGIVMTVIVLIPAPGEWLVGGWDPGVIMNQGIWIGRTGTLHPSMGLLDLLTNPETADLFTNQIRGLREWFPGLPVNLASGEWAFSFYRGTPLFVGFLYQVGGVELALRAMPVLAMIALVVILAVMRRIYTGSHRYPVVLALILVQPVFLYHARTPNYEMLQLLLTIGAVLWADVKSNRIQNGMVLLIGFCMVVNHISFILFGSLLAVCLAAFYRVEGGAARARVGGWLAAGILTGTAYVLFRSVESTAKLQHILPEIYGVATTCVIAVILLTVHFKWPPISGIRWDWLIWPLGMLALVYLEFNRQDPFAEFVKNLKVLAAYQNPLLLATTLIAALVGWVFVPKSRILVTFVFLGLLVVLHRKHVADLYPWALKRYLPFIVPMIACGGACAWSFMAEKRYGKHAMAVVLVIIGFFQAGQLKTAIANVEYTGLNEQLDRVALEIPPSSLVVVDHFKWGVPLAAVHGIAVVNGEIIWSKKSSEVVRQTFDAIVRAKPADTDLYLVSGSEMAMGVYPGIRHEDFVLVGEFPSITFQQAIHHRGNRGFTTRPSSAEFRVYRYQPR